MRSKYLNKEESFGRAEAPSTELNLLTHQTGNYPVTCFVSRPFRITFVNLSFITSKYLKQAFEDEFFFPDEVFDVTGGVFVFWSMFRPVWFFFYLRGIPSAFVFFLFLPQILELLKSGSPQAKETYAGSLSEKVNVYPIAINTSISQQQHRPTVLEPAVKKNVRGSRFVTLRKKFGLRTYSGEAASLRCFVLAN